MTRFFRHRLKNLGLDKVGAAGCRMALPDELSLAAELDRPRRILEERGRARHDKLGGAET